MKQRPTWELPRLAHLEAADGWSTEQRVETLISRLSLPGDAEFSQLSGGLKRRVLLARGEYEPADRAIENYIRAAVAWRAAERGGALIHAASAAWEGRGYLFYGESGAGKSTLLRILAGVESPDTGQVQPGHGLRLGYYAQEHDNLDITATLLTNLR